MAWSALRKNRYKEEIPTRTDVRDIKIVVVGEPKCGKTTFIKTFYDNHRSADDFDGDNFKVYPCSCEKFGQTHNIRIFELVGGPDEIVHEVTDKHNDANGFVLMYAIDDPTSFEKVIDKWYDSLYREKDDLWKNKEPAIVVGNKRDLRNDPQVIERLARDNLAPITEAQGESLVQKEKIGAYFDCSSTEKQNVAEAFFLIWVWGLDNVNKMLGYWWDEPAPEDS